MNNKLIIRLEQIANKLDMKSSIGTTDMLQRCNSSFEELQRLIKQLKESINETTEIIKPYNDPLDW